MNQSVRLTCVIPAYNEAPRIAAVLAAALSAPEIGEVIVVDDGSTDGTAEVVERWQRRAPKLRLLRQPVNGGKTRAVAAGVGAARGHFLMLLDSDLVGLRAHHLSRLATPVVYGRSGASISLRGNAPKSWRLIGLDYISGERVMPRRLLADRLDRLDALPRFGLEVFMNRLWLDDGLEIAVVPWPEVASPMKAEKRGGIIRGVRADLDMLRDMFRTVPPRRRSARSVRCARGGSDRTAGVARLRDAPVVPQNAEIAATTFAQIVEIGAGSGLRGTRIGGCSFRDRNPGIANGAIGRFADIAAFVRIGSTEHPMPRASPHHFLYRSPCHWDDTGIDAACRAQSRSRATRIARDTRIGHNAAIRPAVAIGDGAVVASWLGVTRHMAPDRIVAGVPAKPIRGRFAPDVAERLRELASWDWRRGVPRERLDDFRTLPVEAFLEACE